MSNQPPPVVTPVEATGGDSDAAKQDPLFANYFAMHGLNGDIFLDIIQISPEQYLESGTTGAIKGTLVERVVMSASGFMHLRTRVNEIYDKLTAQQNQGPVQYGPTTKH